MLERTRYATWSALAALLLTAGLATGCQSAPDDRPEDNEPAADNSATGEQTATPEESATPDDGPVNTAQGAMETLRTIETDAEAVEITPLQHGSLILEWRDRIIYVDPTTEAFEAAAGAQAQELPDADLVLVTHIHGDHLDPEAISQVRGEGVAVIAPQSVAVEAGDALADPTIIENGQETSAFDGELQIEAFPMYNLVRKRDNGEFFHPKGRGNAYILTMDGARIYISGDTECTPEMKELENIDAAFLSMNLPYTMPPEEAAECVRAFKPEVLIPYHYRGQEPEKLDEMLDDVPEVELRLLEWYTETE